MPFTPEQQRASAFAIGQKERRLAIVLGQAQQEANADPIAANEVNEAMEELVPWAESAVGYLQSH